MITALVPPKLADLAATLPRPAVTRRASVGRAVAACAAAASILTIAAGCDKARALSLADERDSVAAAPVVHADSLDLRTHPDILFQVFGSQESPRMIPIAAIVGGRLEPILLSAAGWRAFDAQYLRAGRSYALYGDGQARGAAQVKRGMWEAEDEALYKLDGCRSPIPIASLSLDFDRQTARSASVEMLASSAHLGRAGGAHTGSIAAYEVAAPATVKRAVGLAAKLRPATIDVLDFRALGVPTGATAEPTLVATFLDRLSDGAVAPDAMSRHIFVVADRDASGQYRATFLHRSMRPLARAEFRRYVDHLDLDGDGVDEIILEGWHYGGRAFLSVLKFSAGRWTEVYRSPTSWCADEPKK